MRDSTGLPFLIHITENIFFLLCRKKYFFSSHSLDAQKPEINLKALIPLRQDGIKNILTDPLKIFMLIYAI